MRNSVTNSVSQHSGDLASYNTGKWQHYVAAESICCWTLNVIMRCCLLLTPVQCEIIADDFCAVLLWHLSNLWRKFAMIALILLIMHKQQYLDHKKPCSRNL